MTFGYHRNILHIDLSTRKIEVEHPEDDFYRKYMGGSAMGAYYLLKYTPRSANPLSPENTLSFFPSVITGVPISGLSRMNATAKSPINGMIGDAQAGGMFPTEFKNTGFDGLVIRGKAERPVYIFIKDSTVEIRDASHLQGKFIADSEEIIKEELGDPKIKIAQCGPAAEKGVLFSSIISCQNRVFGRTGLGTVMSSKNLRAVAVRGTRKPNVFDENNIRNLVMRGKDNLKSSGMDIFGENGTGGAIQYKNSIGLLPSRNWSSGYIEGIEKISGEEITNTILKKRDTCQACLIRCKRVVEVTEGKYKVDPRYGGPEYETLAALGSYCGVDDLVAICYANQLCDMYGIDTIACGGTIAWAMDCYEHGYLTEKDTGGLELKFGNADAMVDMVEKICKREGLGDILANGSAQAADILGFGKELVVAVKGAELPAHMPHGAIGLGLIYSVNPFGADHESCEHDDVYLTSSDDLDAMGLTKPQPVDSLNEEKISFSLTTQYLLSAHDTLDVCNFVFGPVWHLYNPNDLLEIIHTITGWDVSLDELLRLGRRRLNLLRAFNAREGFGKEMDTFPAKLYVPLKGGPKDGLQIPRKKVESKLNTYYRMAGWDRDGKPTRATLEEIGLEWVADCLELE